MGHDDDEVQLPGGVSAGAVAGFEPEGFGEDALVHREPIDYSLEPAVGELADREDVIDSSGIDFAADAVPDEDLAGFLEPAGE